MFSELQESQPVSPPPPFARASRRPQPRERTRRAAHGRASSPGRRRRWSRTRPCQRRMRPCQRRMRPHRRRMRPRRRQPRGLRSQRPTTSARSRRRVCRLRSPRRPPTSSRPTATAHRWPGAATRAYSTGIRRRGKPDVNGPVYQGRPGTGPRHCPPAGLSDSLSEH
jgi:hypothetical protein